jgi:anti-sigma B factor antagonist
VNTKKQHNKQQMEFEYEIADKKGLKIVSLKGNLIEKSQAQPLLDEIALLIENSNTKFALSLKEFKYMNSTGLNVFITILTRARKAGGEAVLCCVPEKVKQLLIVTKLNTVFTTADSLEGALKKLEQAN